MSDLNLFTKVSKWLSDINYMHRHYGVHEAVRGFDRTKLEAMLKFRVDFINEEFRELQKAREAGDAEEVVDALIDICVVAIGTLDLFGVDADTAWQEVHNANMAKEVGVKAGRPNPLGLPDLIKPTGWTAPSHQGNHGLLSQVQPVDTQASLWDDFHADEEEAAATRWQQDLREGDVDDEW